MTTFWKSKTLWFGLIVALLPWLDQVKASLALDPKAQTAVTVIGLVVMVLRTVTTTALATGRAQ